MFDPNRYTVGWICAIRQEYTAARAFLDEIHDGPDSVSLSNINHYTLGRLGKHHVVTVVLPAGGYGTCSATSVAKDLLHDFPSIRICLMVGVGGGTPSEDHDIRLGDIVVSEPSHNAGGVIQLDSGKEIQDQDINLTPLWSKPSPVLLTAVNGLKTKYEIDGHQLEETISGVLETKPRLRKNYRRPDSNTDRLYKSSVVHPFGSKASCAKVCNNDSSALFLRPQRTEHEDNPMIHYGLIVSSNLLRKNALIRDQLAAENDVLCFEMEAAGLMDHIHCLVIRGICDYSDTHKNEEWKGYAAMAAAAYAKDLLSEISPTQIDAQRKISDILGHMSKNVDSLLHAREDQKCRAIFEWLAATDYSPQQRDYLEKRQKGTCEWLLRSNEFHSWLDRAGGTLFCPGIPGAGKTIAASIVVDHLCGNFQKDENVAIAFVFYNYQQPQTTAADLYSSLLGQLTRPPIRKSIQRLYDSHTTRRTRPSSEEVFHTLKSAISNYSRVFIIIDALDEYSTSDNARLKIATELFTLQAESAANIFVTARHISKITEVFENGGSTIVEIRARDEDIQKYVENHIPDSPPFDTPGLGREIINAIVRATDGMFLLARLHLDSLNDKDSAMKIDESLKRLPKGSDAYSEAYEQAMWRIKGQRKGFSDLAVRVLSWITRSRRPMRTLELQHALAVIPGSLELNLRNLTDPRYFVDVCAGLVTLDKERGVIRLVHYTTQEYFEQSWMTWFPDANQHIATVCLTYLAFEQFSAGPARGFGEYRKRLQENCLYEYAAQHWGYYASESYTEVKDLTARFLRNDSTLASATQVLLERVFSFNPLKIWEGITGLHIAAYHGINDEVVDFLRGIVYRDVADSYGRTPLHWAARNCQIKTVDFLLREGLGVNATDTEKKSALHYAASQDNRTLIQLLLKYGALIEAGDLYGQAPLLVAADVLGVEAAKELLSHGAEINALDIMNRNALHLAIVSAKTGSTSLTDLLLSWGIDLSACDVENMTPLHYAVANRSRQIIDSLLKAGADINFGVERKHWTKSIESGRPLYECRVPEAEKQKIKDAVGLTPLHFGACIGDKAMTEYLLSKGANPNARCQDGDTPLHIALRRCLLETQRERQKLGYVLPDNDGWTDDSWRIELSADFITDYGGEEATEIYQYIEEERLAVVNALLASTSIEVNIPNIELDSPIHTVRYDDANANYIVHKLLALGADPFLRNSKGQTALHFACKAGASAIACDFLDRGCCIKSADLEGLNALHYAFSADQYDTVRIILERDQQIAQDLCREADAGGKTLLHHHLETSTFFSIDMIVALLGHGASLNSTDQDGNTPLSLYLQSSTLIDRTEVCQFLLENGADALWTSPKGENLAHLTMCNHKAEPGILAALRDHGVDLTAKDNSGKTILHHGAIHGSLSEEILNFVQENNDRLRLSVDDTDEEGKTPQEYASEEANKEHSPMEAYFGAGI